MTELVTYPEFGVTVNVVVEPEVTDLEEGEIVPFEPAVPVTVYEGTAHVDPFQDVPDVQLAVAVEESSWTELL